MVVVLCINSCKKPENNLCDKNSANFKGKNIHQNADVTAPTVSNGMLVFTSKEDYDAWLEYLGDVTLKDTTNTDSTDYINETLGEIEQGLGFNSLRKDLREQYDALNETGWDAIEDVPELHFLHDPTIQSVLNVDGDVKIGDDIYEWIDKHHIIVIKDAGLLNAVHTFKSNGYDRIEDIYLITGAAELDANGDQTNHILVQYLENEVPLGSVSLQKTSGSTFLQNYGTVKSNSCNPKEVTVNNFYVSDPSNALAVSCFWTIDWGDGTTEGPFTATYFGKTHTYSSFGSKTITIIAIPTGLTSGTYTFAKTFPLNECGKDTYKSKSYWRYSNDGNRAFECYGEVVVSALNNKIYASTTAYKKKNGKFKEHKADRIAAQVWGDILNYSNCGFDKSASAADWPYNDKHCKAVRHIGYRFGWETIHTDHKMWYDGTVYDQELSLPICQ